MSAGSKVAFFVVAVAALGAGAYVHLNGAGASARPDRPADAVQAAPFELAAVDVATAAAGALRETLRVSGVLRPARQASLRAASSGTVLEVAARTGEAVEAGQLLVALDSGSLRAAAQQHESSLQSASAQLLLAEQALEKAAELAGKGFASRAVLEKAQGDVVTASAGVRSAEAQLGAARKALEDAEIRAPFAGVVAQRSAEPGENASAGAELVSLVDVSSLEAEVAVSTRDVRLLSAGQEVSLSVEGAADRVVGRVDRVSPVATDGSRSVPVFVRIDNAGGSLWGGMFATGEIEVRSEAGAVSVPAAAVRSDGDGGHVLKVEDGVLVRQGVDVVAAWDGGRTLQVSVGLEGGETVIVSPLPGVGAGTKVAVPAAR